MNENLQARTKKFTLRIVKLYQSLPNTSEAQIIGKQLFRSGISVGANTRAAFRGRSNKEFKAKLGVVVEEADECIFWLEILQDSSICNSSDVEKLKIEANELTSIFVSILKK
jgi:four helix bundle protein